MRRLTEICLVGLCCFVAGCGSSSSTSGVSNELAYSEQEQDNLFKIAFNSGKGLVSTDAPAPKQTALARCKVRYAYMYTTKTYVTLKGCIFKSLKLTGNLRGTGATVATIAKSRNMTVFISYSGSRMYWIAL